MKLTQTAFLKPYAKRKTELLKKSRKRSQQNQKANCQIKKQFYIW